MSAEERYESSADRQIREAQERGEFDDLPGAGKPLRLSGIHDPDRWVKSWVEREQLSMVLPTSLALRKEAQELPDTVAKLRTEDAVRDLVEDFNARVIEARRRPVEGPPLVVRTFDVDEVLSAWRGRRTA